MSGRRGEAHRPASPARRSVAPRRHGVLAAVAGFLIEPAEPIERVERTAEQPGVDAHPVPPQLAVAVVGLARGCGTTAVARAIGAEVARRAAGPACVVGDVFAEAAGVPLGMPAAARLARSLGTAFGVRARAVGRICAAACELDGIAPLAMRLRDVAPLVLDVGDPAGASVAASVSDVTVLVASPTIEPALADLVAVSLERVGTVPIVVLNEGLRSREADVERWQGRCALNLPSSRLGARLALAGREPCGELGAAVGRLVDLVAARES